MSWRRKHYEQGWDPRKHLHLWGRKGKENQQKEVRTERHGRMKGALQGRSNRKEMEFSVSRGH